MNDFLKETAHVLLCLLWLSRAVIVHAFVQSRHGTGVTVQSTHPHADYTYITLNWGMDRTLTSVYSYTPITPIIVSLCSPVQVLKVSLSTIRV